MTELEPTEQESDEITRHAADAMALQQQNEALRQRRAIFDQRIDQDARWFNLRLAMGRVATVLIPAVAVVSLVLVLMESLPLEIRLIAASALLVDVLGLAVAVWKIALSPANDQILEPTVDDDPALEQIIDVDPQKYSSRRGPEPD